MRAGATARLANTPLANAMAEALDTRDARRETITTAAPTDETRLRPFPLHV